VLHIKTLSKRKEGRKKEGWRNTETNTHSDRSHEQLKVEMDYGSASTGQGTSKVATKLPGG
jgi:hypothetical protein